MRTTIVCAVLLFLPGCVSAPAPTFEVRRERMAVHMGDMPREVVVLVGRDSRSGLTLWQFVDWERGTPEEQFLRSSFSESDTAVAMTRDEVVRFSVLNLKPDIGIIRSRVRFASLDAAFSEVKRMLPAERRAGRQPSVETTVVSLGAYLGGSFAFAVAPDAAGAPLPKIAKVECRSGGCVVTLKSASGATAAISLDAAYHVTDARYDHR